MKVECLVSLVFVGLLLATIEGANKACPFKPADIIFVVDASGSEGANNFNKQLGFIKNFTAQFEIGPNNTLVSLVTFATAIKNEFYLDRYSTKPDVLNAIAHSTYLNGETYTHLALDHVRNFNIKPNHGARANVSKIVIVLTDGRSNEEALTKTAAARLKHEPGVTVMAIGIGNNVDPAELTAIASDANHTYRVPDFDALSTIKSDLTDTACNVCDYSFADIFFVLDSSGSEGNTGFHHQLDFTKLVINSFQVGVDNTHIGIAKYSTRGNLEISLRSPYSRDQLMQSIDNIPYTDGESNAHLGLNLALDQFHKYSHRQGAARYCVVLTDGRSNEPYLTIHSADMLHRMGVEVFVVAVGHGLDYTELGKIASDRKHVFTVPNLYQLSTANITQFVSGRICAKSSNMLTSTVVPTTLPPTSKPECGQQPADILFILDSSDSEGPDNFQTMLTFVRNFALQFPIGPNNVQFSVLTFSTGVSPEFYFNTYHSRHGVIRAIQRINYLGTGTNTSTALNYARLEMFLPIRGARPNASKIAIVITDGHSVDQTSTSKEASELQKIAEVFAIGVGPDVDQSELKAIASGSGTSHIVQVNSFDLLKTIQKQLTDSACSGTKVSATTMAGGAMGISTTPAATTKTTTGRHHHHTTRNHHHG